MIRLPTSNEILSSTLTEFSDELQSALLPVLQDNWVKEDLQKLEATLVGMTTRGESEVPEQILSYCIELADFLPQFSKAARSRNSKKVDAAFAELSFRADNLTTYLREEINEANV